MRVDHMGDQRNAAGPKAAIRLHPGHAACGHGSAGAVAKRAMHLRPVHTDLFKHRPTAQNRHQATTAILTRGGGDLKADRAVLGGFQPFKRADDVVAQVAEPGGSAGFVVGVRASVWASVRVGVGHGVVLAAICCHD